MSRVFGSFLAGQQNIAEEREGESESESDKELTPTTKTRIGDQDSASAVWQPGV
jgi:hypothetical protein